MEGKIILGTRGSELAQTQTQLVESALAAAYPNLELERRIIVTAGDTRQDIPLCEVNRATNTQDKGVFIAALEEALASGEIDCAVHSLKDMPGELDERFEIAAILPREAIEDVLILKQGAKMNQLSIGTSSVRRMKFVECYWGGTARCLPIRGNVATRINKLIENHDMDAIILARAGLNRLNYPQDQFEVNGQVLSISTLDRRDFMPALGQGAVAVEIRKGDTRTRNLLQAAHDQATENCILCEREFLRCLQADCSVPVGGYASVTEDIMIFRALYFTPEGIPLRITQRGAASNPESVGRNAYAQLRERLQQ